MTVETCQVCNGEGVCPRCHGWGVDYDGHTCAICRGDADCPNPQCRGGDVDVEPVLQTKGRPYRPGCRTDL